MTADLAPSVEARLRAALDAAATTDPVPPGWDAIREQVEGGDTVALPFVRRRSKLLLAAACVALLLGLAAVAIATQDSEQVHTDGPADDPYCAALARPARAGVLVRITLEPGATPAEVAAVEAALGEGQDVEGVDFVDQEAAFAEAQALFADEPTMLDVLRVEDTPPRFEVEVAHVAAADVLVGGLRRMPAVIDAQADGQHTGSDLFSVLVGLSRGRASFVLSARPVDPEVVEALRASAPEPIQENVAEVAPHLQTLPVAPPTASRAAAHVATHAAGWCGRDLPPDPDGDPAVTTADVAPPTTIG